MGKEAVPQLIKEYGGEVQSTELRAYVKQVGRKLAKQVEPEYKNIKWNFYVLNSDVVNAFSLPPGEIFITMGMLSQLRNEAELAAVLGHEMGHVTAKHVAERVSLAQGLQTGGDILSSSVGGSSSTTQQLLPLVVGGLGQGFLLKFSRDQESEADRQGVKYMVKSGYDPQGAAEVMRILMEADKGKRQLEILSTHPDPEKRLNDVQHLIQSQYSNTQNNPKYGKFADRFQQKAGPYLLRSPSGTSGSKRTRGG
jgi:predicted Zn-dependent protease